MADVKEIDQEFLQSCYLYAANSMRDRMPTPQIENKLVERGLSPDAAEKVVRDMKQAIAEENEAKKATGQKNMIYGALWCIGGILVTVITYAMAEGGGRFLLAWGAVVFGGIQFIRGAIQSASST